MSPDKQNAREMVWMELAKVARPDSRFHMDFSSFIPDFQGSDIATQLLKEMDIYRQARVVFVTPDNCLEHLKAQVLRDDKVLLTSTYGIRRGFVILTRQDVPEGLEEFSILLDVIETLGAYVSLAEIQARYPIDLMVTGASVVNTAGIRFGKGHGFFDLEWGMFYGVDAVNVDTPVVAFVHDCQVVDLPLDAKEHDTICDYVVTPTRALSIETPQKPACGIVWGKLQAGMVNEIPPLQELWSLRKEGEA